ncbi:MAG TPA: envelope stress response membrane protein PspB [Rhizorhapis sp.]|nr:envelope stress response membrane protein PspB [Rhizorhapis sp.]
MEDTLVPIMVVGMLFIGLPWLILHYVTRWKTAATLTTDDERLLDDLHETARRLEERLATIERIVAADHPDWNPARPVVPSDYDLDRRN